MAVRLVVDVNFSEKNGLTIYQRCEPLTGQVAREESAFVTAVMNVNGRVVKDINRQQALRKEMLSVLKRFEEMAKGDGGNGC
ncbi:hypothetical protein E0577_17920 [Salmonella enterica subsp. enterica serovar Richmond]|uniref:hypothetical protein n=1 Tax=Salmonella bongori TaxID=54736 RepID=UPI000A2845FE|nr:hypothetical protein [Salmonella bongori]EBP1801172.1 hypothetical protein [Salmonella enterica]EBY7514925.1 hypothetical protein [Salmonella enterica subsp. enterica serovar Richmond]ECB6674287.1 hypothetical protein [Salmonella enterica subsp. enterica serovar Kottbus]ECB6852722.1 hypothetical protein [Salmonella enterica subsp. enterica serovar Hvittingfoss]EDG9409555.1 hypothetical protein [Salmonella enterica subsp. enterica serovar Tennessee]